MPKKNTEVRISPEGSLDILSQLEVNKLLDASKGGLYSLFRKCALAVLNSDSDIVDIDNAAEIFSDFDIRIIQQNRGLKLGIKNAPFSAFVNGEMIKGIREHLFSVLRDIIYINNEIDNNKNFNLNTSDGITNAVFHILRNAGVLKSVKKPNLVVCWGGHSIGSSEYEYTREVGYEMGLRGLDVCTGCGPGAMKGPMKGTTIGHAKQRIKNGRYIGLTEPGIIAAESPNPIVNKLVIMPDIEKRLEAFLRLGHGFVVFPGGVGTAEEILYMLGILLHPDNLEIPFPLFLTGPRESEEYFHQIDNFISSVLGDEARNLYKIIIGNPKRIANELNEHMGRIRSYRKNTRDAFYFNWQLKIEKEFQFPFNPTHDNMAKLEIRKDMDKHKLTANLRKLFSGIVAGNVKDEGICSIKKFGPFKINGDKEIMDLLDKLLESFVKHNRMKVGDVGKYVPCYEVVS